MKETNFKDTEIGKIPAEWEVSTLGNIGEPLMCKRIMKWQTNTKSGIPFYKIGTFGLSPDSFISNNVFEYYKAHYNYPKKGDILISAAGTIGRTVVFDGKPAYFQDSNIVWLDNDQSKVLNSFLKYYYKIIKWKTEDGGIVTRLYNNNLKSTWIALPPLSEQRRIADALSKVDSLIESIDKLIAKKQVIKKGAMQELLTGKKRLPGFDGEWEKEKLGNIASMYSGGTPASSNPNYYGGNINFLSISDMSASGKYIKSTEKSITELGLVNSSAKIFPAGTLMYAMYASLGKCSITRIETAISQAILGFKLSEIINREFLYYHFCYIENKVKKIGQTGTQSNLSKTIVENFTILIPPLSEQRAIAHVLSSIDSEIEALERKRDKYKQVKQGMMQDLLTGRIRLTEN